MKISVLASRSRPSFRSAVLIETDPHLANQIQRYAEDIGITRLEICPNVEDRLGPDAASHDLLILDWNAKGAQSGIAAFNRLRHDPRLTSVPILVISGFVERNDFRLLEEFALTRLLEKPFTAGVFIEAVQSLQEELDWVHANDKALRRLLQKDSEGSPRIRKIQKLLQTAPYPAPFLLMVGRHLSREKCWDEARDFLQQVVQEDCRNVLALNELGKVLHASGRHREAIAVLTQADCLSPDNLKRICQLGELHLHQCQLDIARHNFERVLTIDPSWDRARQGHELASNALDYLQTTTATGSIPQSFASLMNTIGIAKVHSGLLEEGIRHYESALGFLRDHDVRGRVMFNMGLGYLRHRLEEKALLWFMRSARSGGPALARARAYVEELTQRAVWTEDGLRIMGNIPGKTSAQGSVSTPVYEAYHKPEVTPPPAEPISLVSGDDLDHGDWQSDELDTDALLSGVVEEAFC